MLEDIFMDGLWWWFRHHGFSEKILMEMMMEIILNWLDG